MYLYIDIDWSQSHEFRILDYPSDYLLWEGSCYCNIHRSTVTSQNLIQKDHPFLSIFYLQFPAIKNKRLKHRMGCCFGTVFFVKQAIPCEPGRQLKPIYGKLLVPEKYRISHGHWLNDKGWRTDIETSIHNRLCPMHKGQRNQVHIRGEEANLVLQPSLPDIRASLRVTFHILVVALQHPSKRYQGWCTLVYPNVLSLLGCPQLHQLMPL